MFIAQMRMGRPVIVTGYSNRIQRTNAESLKKNNKQAVDAWRAITNQSGVCTTFSYLFIAFFKGELNQFRCLYADSFVANKTF
jgi:hypothetical protein